MPRPPPFTFGDTPRALSNPRGPGFASVDLSVVRDIAFSQTSSLQLRAEFFNLFNRVNFNQPNTNFLSGRVRPGHERGRAAPRAVRREAVLLAPDR